MALAILISYRLDSRQSRKLKSTSAHITPALRVMTLVIALCSLQMGVLAWSVSSYSIEVCEEEESSNKEKEECEVILTYVWPNEYDSLYHIEGDKLRADHFLMQQREYFKIDSPPPEL